MANGISTGVFRKGAEKQATFDKLKAEFARQAKKSKKRGFLSNMLGGLGGKLLPQLIKGALKIGSTSPWGIPIAALSMFLSKKAAHEATRGMAADPSQLKSIRGKYGSGEREGKIFSEQLKEHMVTDPFKEKGLIGAELAGAGLQYGLENVGDWFKGAKGKDALGKNIDTAVKGRLQVPAIQHEALKPTSAMDWRGNLDKLSSTPLIPAKEKLDMTPNIADLLSLQSGFEPAYDDTAVSEEFDEYDYQSSSEFQTPFQQGGRVPKYRNGGSISDYFGQQGMSLGGSSTQSMGEMLNRRK